MQEPLEITIPYDLAGKRFDACLAELFPDYSRSRLQQWVKEGLVTLNGEEVAIRHKVLGGEKVLLTPVVEVDDTVEAEDVPLDILYEDDQLLVVNKPAGLVVHPAAGNWHGTMQNGLLFHCPDNAKVPRAGIVHRLDKETSGLLVVAKTIESHKYLVEQLQQRLVKRHYVCLVNGTPTGGATVDAPIGRNPGDRKKMAVVQDGKPAVTHYTIRERYQKHTLLDVRLETGRTHQIRVHMAHVNLPLVGDPVYGRRLKLPPNADAHLVELLRTFKRQALHARTLKLVHPTTGKEMTWKAPIPEDLHRLCAALGDHDEASWNIWEDEEDDFDDDGGMEVHYEE